MQSDIPNYFQNINRLNFNAGIIRLSKIINTEENNHVPMAIDEDVGLLFQNENIEVVEVDNNINNIDLENIQVNSFNKMPLKSTIEKWSNDYPCIVYDELNNVLKCTTCMDYVEYNFVNIKDKAIISGSKLIRLETIKTHIHAVNGIHFKAMSYTNKKPVS